METIIAIIIILTVIVLVYRRGIRNLKKSDTELSVFEHPGTFKKSGIEMVSKPRKQSVDKIENTTPFSTGNDGIDNNENIVL